MKFMGTYVMHPEKRHELYKTFAQMTDADDAEDRGGAVKQIGRWHDLAAGKGMVVCESDDPAAVQSWALNWNNGLDVEIGPCLDDDEARAAIKKKFNL